MLSENANKHTPPRFIEKSERYVNLNLTQHPYPTGGLCENVYSINSILIGILSAAGTKISPPLSTRYPLPYTINLM